MSGAKRRAEKIARMQAKDARLKRTTHIGDDGLRRCNKHGKVYYGSAGKAHEGLIAYLRHPQADPGAVTYGCRYTGGWHIGHPQGWKSLGRLMDEAAGVYRMERPA